MMMTRKEGISFDRVHEYECCRKAEKADFNTVQRIIDKLYSNGDNVLAYSTGVRVGPEELKKVTERMENCEDENY